MKKIGVIGAGAMGAGIAQVAATAGHEVYLFDVNPIALEKAMKGIEAGINKLVEKQKISGETAASIISKIISVKELNNIKDADLIIEAIVENISIKKEIFAQLEMLVSEHCILASNTSSLSITSISSALKSKSRFLGIHFFNPAVIMPLVEIIPGIASELKIVEECKNLISSWGKSVVICKDTPGFIVNRIARPYYGEAMRIYEEGIADISTIDWAMKEIGGFKMGPFELTDMIGHDVNYVVTETVWSQFYFDQRFKPMLCQKRLYEAGFYGRKSGRGFYDYSENVSLPEPKKDKVLAEEIFMRIISMLINEAYDALYLNVASESDLETAMMKGVNYPKGLLQWGRDLGLNDIVKKLDALYHEYGEDRYRVCLQLRRLALQNV
jgi:3-hydroxybutyryl-CoA dehydrogenase